ncbi:hypothetical protein O181_031531 [Austropuccinia psidii MF-1]|uniref:Chromo domain-containing protein n=1 Tax=Austropuccinia psidii MF-1 TaxID=1389203 RepID=A0A9Q3H5A2_9BASI|nr:hypothetical protein [Austropuccinia psidii MF-1]
MRLVKPCHQTEGDRLTSRIKSHTPQELVEVEDSPAPVKIMAQARMIILNVKDHRQYLVRFKSHTDDKDKWLAEDALEDGDANLRIFIASRRA